MKIISSQGRARISLPITPLFFGVLLWLFCPSTLGATSVQGVGAESKDESIPFEEAVRRIESKNDYTFMYSTATAQAMGKVKMSTAVSDLKAMLDQIFADKPFTYYINDKVIVVGPRKEEPAARPAQEPVVISGTITDENGEPLPGATVRIKGTNVGMSTDIDGNFKLQIPEEHRDISILVVSFVGMKSQEVDITGRSEVSVQLEIADQLMNDVVVTGIFNKAPESYTGAAQKITSEDLQIAGNRSILTSISNIDPSFNIVPNVEFGSDPNQLPNITMRGRTSISVNVQDLQDDTENQSSANLPLFILNGFEVSLQRVMDMDQSIVESITLLKDASATALYGSRGANGIVVITTRRPEQGKLRVSYQGSLNIEAPDLSSYNLMNAQEKLDYELAAGLYTYHLGTYNIYNQQFAELYNQRLIDVERGVDTYWMKYPLRTGVGNRHSLQVDGGDDHFKYAGGLAYNNIAGVMKDSYRNTLTGNLFFQYGHKNVKFQNELIIAQNQSNNSPYGTFSDYALTSPLYTPYDEEGNLKKMLNETSVTTNNPPLVGNPLFNASLPYKDESSYTSIQNNFAIDWRISDDLSVRGRFGLTKQDQRTDKYLSREHTSFETSAYEGDNYKLRGSYTYGTDYSFSYETNLTLNYNKTLGEVHQIYAGFNYNMAESKQETYSITAQGFSASNMANLGMAGGYPEGSQPSSTEQHSRRMGALLNFNYTFDQRYFVDFSGNIEGSSKFGSNDRIAPFYSAGLGWNVHHEDFLKNSSTVDALRLRLSYGTSGSQSFSSFQALTTYRYFDQQTYKNWTGAYMLGIGNPDLGWQTTAQTNIGLETSLFKRRIRLNVDFYNKLTDGLLTDINMPTSSGFSSYKANVGQVQNRGVEVNVNAFLIRNQESRFSWSVNASLIHNQNEILEISNSLEFLNSELMEESGANPSFLYEEGQSLNTIFVVRSLGIDPATGTEVFLDKDGNRTDVWDASDKVAYGVAEPKVWGNFGSMVRWRNLSLNTVFSYRAGGYLYNQTLVDKVENISRTEAWGNLDRRAYYDRWQSAGDVTRYKDISDFNATQASSRFVMKENTIQMTSANLSYEFDTQWLQKNLRVNYLTVSLYAENLFYLSTVQQERGTTYPFSRKFSLMVSARF